MRSGRRKVEANEIQRFRVFYRYFSPSSLDKRNENGVPERKTFFLWASAFPTSLEGRDLWDI